MGKITKNIIRTLFVFVLMTIFIPQHHSKAAENNFHYVTLDGKENYSADADTALKQCFSKGGIIEVIKDFKFNIPEYIKYGRINKNTTLVIRNGVTVTIGEYGFCLDGNIRIHGTLDLEHSQGDLYGTGKIEVIGGKVIKRNYTVDQGNEKICLTGGDIMYGEPLSKAVIYQDQINWRPSIEGTWQFLDQDLIPQVGTNKYDIVFKPACPLTYDEKIFRRCGSVTTKSTVPVRHRYTPIKLYAGECLLNAEPDILYIDPIRGEEVKGQIEFSQAEQPLVKIGEQKVKGVFIPDNKNYAEVTEYFDVEVQKTTPQIQNEPLTRNQGSYGDTLAQIQIIPGICVHPTNGNVLEGKWEWQDSSQRLELGKKKYTLLFLPIDQGYEIKQLQVEVTTHPREMKDIEWPVCTDLIYGQRLADCELSFYKNEYGTFCWENDNLFPNVKNKGAVVLFRPANFELYDWSKMAGYDREKGTISFVIPIRVCPLIGKLPDIKATEVEEGQCVSGSAICVSGMPGKVVWQEPAQTVLQSGEYMAYFQPEDCENYDWSLYNPDEQGKISVPIYVKAKKRKEVIEDVNKEKEDDENEESKEAKIPISSAVTEEKEGHTDDVETPTFVITQMVSKISKIRSTKVKVKKTKWVSRKRKNSRAKLTWRKIKGVQYQIQYGTDKKWRNSKKKMVRKASITLKRLNRKRKYYVRIRCVKVKGGEKYYSKWSSRAELV